MGGERDATPSLTPYAIGLCQRGQEPLTRIIKWIERSVPLRNTVWEIVNIETIGVEMPVVGTQLNSQQLDVVIDSQVIALILRGYQDKQLLWEIRVTDGSLVDLLGFGVPPSEFEIGRWKALDPESFYWRAR